MLCNCFTVLGGGTHIKMNFIKFYLLSLVCACVRACVHVCACVCVCVRACMI